jgi:hypothetical protein
VTKKESNVRKKQDKRNEDKRRAEENLTALIITLSLGHAEF